jgi:hypothetical protein
MEGSTALLLIAVPMTSGLACAAAARDKGRPPFLFLVLGLILIGWPVLWALRPREIKHRDGPP